MSTSYVNTFLVLLRTKFPSHMKKFKQIKFCRVFYHTEENIPHLTELFVLKTSIFKALSYIQATWKEFRIFKKITYTWKERICTTSPREKTDIQNVWSKCLEVEFNHTVLTAWWIFISSTSGQICCPSG